MLGFKGLYFMKQCKSLEILVKITKKNSLDIKNVFEKLDRDAKGYLLLEHKSYMPNGLFENFLTKEDAPIDEMYKSLILNVALKYNFTDFLKRFLATHALIILPGAIHYGRMGLIEKLDLDFSKLDVAEKGEYLLIASKFGHLSIVNFLLEIKGEPILTSAKEEALFWAASYERLEVKEYLESIGIGMKVDEKQQLPVLGNSPLEGARMLSFSAPRPMEKIDLNFKYLNLSEEPKKTFSYMI
jgi:hypothetical protein